MLCAAAVDCATIHLHGALADFELAESLQENSSRSHLPNEPLGGHSFARCTEACRNIALATAYVEEVDTSYLHQFIAVTWLCAAELMAKQVPKLRQSGYIGRAQEMEQQMIVMEKGMDRMVKIYPLHSKYFNIYSRRWFVYLIPGRCPSRTIKRIEELVVDLMYYHHV